MKKTHANPERLPVSERNARQSCAWGGHPRCCVRSGNAKRWRRSYCQGDHGSGRVAIEDIEAEVPHHQFWHRFVDNWERETELVYRQFVKPGGVVLDIGAWIGPTVIYALACRASRIVALEPNPDSFAALAQIPKSISGQACRIDLLNLAIGGQEGEISMGLPEGSSDTSRSGWEGRDFVAKSITLEQLVESQDIECPDLVKIDIEGGEASIAKGIANIASCLPVVHLSVHVPFFPPDADLNELISAVSAYEVFDDRGRRLSSREFAERVTSPEQFPVWGGRKGNFFEVLMLSKNT